MFILYCLLGILAIGILLLLFTKRYRNKGLLITLIAICTIFIWCAVAIRNISDRAHMTELYNSLNLYKDAVEASDDEALRFDFYSRIEKWNEVYENTKKNMENPWTRWIVVPNINLSEVKSIEFELKR